MKHIQMMSRVLYRSFVITMIIFLYNPAMVWALPFGFLIGMLTEAEYLSGGK